MDPLAKTAYIQRGHLYTSLFLRRKRKIPGPTLPNILTSTKNSCIRVVYVSFLQSFYSFYRGPGFYPKLSNKWL